MHIIVHYQEIVLKGKNRHVFVKKLIDNIRYATTGLGAGNIRHKDGRIILDLPSNADEAKICNRLSKTFGIANFVLTRRLSNDVNLFKDEVLHYIKGREFKSFRVSTRRGYKGYPLTSMDVDRIVGAHIKESIGARVNLTNPELVVHIQILSGETYFYIDRIQGPGGLPVGTGGTVVCLLSGGIDSPVAAWRMMKRGCSVIFVHFHSYPYLSKASQEKVQDITEILNEYQRHSRAYLLPFGDIQKDIVLSVPAKYRVVIYRRMMLRVAERIAAQTGALALVTGDSLGQVASQTLENISTTGDAVTLPILRPLIGMDKEEIIAQAKRIGTYDISIIPDQDCCQLFIPKNPSLRTTIREIERVEKRLDIEGLIKMALAHIK
ncbi:MAG: tRNA 4-thiouridine(8) synthase ThiI [Nitrospirae bacterium]|nr:tRNA 4-thiouridine(8) synthase ThiI [Nitrospirota bacterium]